MEGHPRSGEEAVHPRKPLESENDLVRSDDTASPTLPLVTKAKRVMVPALAGTYRRASRDEDTRRCRRAEQSPCAERTNPRSE